MDWNLANKITLVRIFLIPVFLVVLLGGFLEPETSRLLSTAIFVLASFTDFLDGYIARSRNMITNLGKFMDPIADKLLVAAALIALVELSELSAWVVILILSREFIISAFRTIAASQNVVIAAGIWGKIKTVVQMVMIIYVLVDFKGEMFEIIGFWLIIAAVVMTVVSGVEYVYKNLNVLKGK